MTPGALPLGSSIAEARQSPIGPTAEHPLPGGGTRLEFRQGRQTYMLDYDAAGRLVTSRQVLTPEVFATVTPGMTQDEVLARIGRPVHVTGIGWQKQQLLNYRFGGLEGDCMIFQVSISNATGNVTEAGTGPDPQCSVARRQRAPPRSGGEPRARRARSHSVAAAARDRQAARSWRSTNGRMPPCL